MFEIRIGNQLQKMEKDRNYETIERLVYSRRCQISRYLE